MVSAQEPYHLEYEGFFAKVPLRPERDGQIDLPEREHLHSRDDLVERC